MCRWFAYISPSEPCLLEDILVTPSHSLSKQVHSHYLPKLVAKDGDKKQEDMNTSRETLDEIARRNVFYNIDGLGVVWYTSARSEYVDGDYGSYPVTYKSLLHPLSDPAFLSISAHTSTKACFAHIRAAVPSALQPLPTLSQFNCHPFTRGRYSIMHNGTVADFERIRREVMDLMGEDEARWVKGNTDSEALAGVFFTYLGEETKCGSNVVHAGPRARAIDLVMLKQTLVRTITAILDTQKRVIGGGNANAPLTSSDINLAITDGQQLICCRFRNHLTEEPPSLYYSTTAGVTLNRKYPDHPDGPYGKFTDRILQPHIWDHQEGHSTHSDTATFHQGNRGNSYHGAHVIVASEPTTYRPSEWTLIGKNECVMVEMDGSIMTEAMEIVIAG